MKYTEKDIVNNLIPKGIYYDSQVQMCFDKNSDNTIIDVRAYGTIQHLKVCETMAEANDFQDALGKFIADAINEKIQRLEQS